MKNKGFTLIELLVVVAIIGILAAIVIAALGSARLRAKDSAVAQAVSSYRAQAELDFQGNFIGLCSSSSFNEIQTYVESQGGEIDSCDESTVDYRIVATLPSALAQAQTIPATAYAAFEDAFCINSLGSATRVNLAELAYVSAPYCVEDESGTATSGDMSLCAGQATPNACSAGSRLQ
jgi:prepilin-type N-terminal cleavage/methylation domain-containing protein